MNMGEKFGEKERKLVDTLLAPSENDNLDEQVKRLTENQNIMIENTDILIQNQNILKNERDELIEEITHLQTKNKKNLKNIKYGVIGVLSFAAISSAILLPDFVKILSIGFICPIVSQLYYLFRDRQNTNNC